MNGARRLIDIKELRVSRGGATELEGLSLSLSSGESVVVLGEKSSGKDALMRVLGNFTDSIDEIGGTIQYGNAEAKPLAKRSKPALRISYLCAARSAPLNPYASVVSQLVRIVARRLNVPIAGAREDLRITLERISPALNFSDLGKKPGELSDIALSWALLAAAAAQTPDLLVADHAFSGLTPTSVETLAAALLVEQKRQGFALAYFAEGLQTAAHLRGRMIVLRRGKVIEEGDFEKLAGGQSHAYSQMLFKALPRLEDKAAARGAARGEPLLQVQGLELASRKKVRSAAHDGLSFELRRGASLAFVGEEGSGRRRLVRAILGLDRFPKGRVVLDQIDIGILTASMTSRLRRRIAFITGSGDALDPRMTVWDTVEEPLRAHLRLPRDMVAGYRETALKRVGLASHDGKRSVATLSAFDKRRLQAARAIVSAPILAVIDEPLRGLDAFAQSVMIDLLKDLREQDGPAFLIVTADMRVAQALADDVMIFKDGKLVERGPLADITRTPRDDETRRLLAAAAPQGRVHQEKEAPLEPLVPDEVSAGAREPSVPVEQPPPEEPDSPFLLDDPVIDAIEPAEFPLDQDTATERSG